jgi:hypothetical protein
MPPTTYHQTILRCFTAMEIDGLRLYLKEEHTYQQASKEVFLDKLEAIFEKHRAVGDTKLLLYPGACASETCPNCGIRGYRFVGNHTNNYLDLLFEMKGDDITDILSCSQFRPDCEISNLGSHEYIQVDLDDQANFPKSSEYWARVYDARDAHNELVTEPRRKIEFDEINYWLNKHAALFKKLGGYNVFKPSMQWTPFLAAYSNTQDLVHFVFDNLDEIRQANQSLAQLKTEQETIDWLVKYEAISHWSSLDALLEEINDGEHIYYKKGDLFLFRSEEYQDVCSFLFSYLNNNQPLIDKYTIYTAEEEQEMYNEENIREEKPDLHSLSFHLTSRKELEEMGIYLPFYLGTEDKQTGEIDVPF